MSRKQIGEALEYSDPRVAIAKLHASHKERLDKFSGVTDTVTPGGGAQKSVIYSAKGVYEICRWSEQPKANAFFDFVYDLLEGLRTGTLKIISAPQLKDAFEMQLIGVDYASRILRVDETSKLKMLETAHKHFGVPTDHLPMYVDEEVTKSLTVLLKENGVKTSTAKVNTKLIELGVLEIKDRLSSKGGKKEFKSLTEKGLYYGKNLINPKSPKETQPHYFESKFPELLRLIEGDAA
ncbi:hypothetical protein J9303_01070 [Bacillaceae bacterium Marseille-Q3522]|nr:hypothetical protein [Bacillaceae bacterium Marseille-Q3522]